MANKGTPFERDLCRSLSLWWTEGQNKDVFWRTAGSGARATTRAQKGDRLEFHNGDIGVINPIGQPLLDLVTIECKRGYSKMSFADLFDFDSKKKQLLWEAWIQQAAQSSEDAGVYGWLLITRRDKKECMVMMPRGLYNGLETARFMRSGNIRDPHYFFEANLRIRLGDKKGRVTGTADIRVMGLRYLTFIKRFCRDDVLAFNNHLESS